MLPATLQAPAKVMGMVCGSEVLWVGWDLLCDLVDEAGRVTTLHVPSALLATLAC